jgi:hypothetical protein
LTHIYLPLYGSILQTSLLSFYPNQLFHISKTAITDNIFPEHPSQYFPDENIAKECLPLYIVNDITIYFFAKRFPSFFIKCPDSVFPAIPFPLLFLNKNALLPKNSTSLKTRSGGVCHAIFPALDQFGTGDSHFKRHFGILRGKNLSNHAPRSQKGRNHNRQGFIHRKRN